MQNIGKKYRENNFIKYWLPKFKEVYGDNFYYVQNGQHYELKLFYEDTGNKYYLHYYPKGNKVLIRHLNKWIKERGLEWMIENFLNKVNSHTKQLSMSL
jgi:hypothetical protein